MKILFVGNSYTYFNDLPELIRKLSEENEINAEVTSVTKGGWRIWRFLDLNDENTANLNSAIEKSPYDAVILQDQSLISVLENDRFEDGMTRMAKRLEGKTDRIILYQTWGRKQGSPAHAETGLTYEQMANGITSAYRKTATDIGAELSPVGEYFYVINGKYPEIELYADDMSHPSLLGSSLAALVHFRVLYGKLPDKCNSLQLPDDVLEIFMSELSKSED
ncbi:MAG: hypothetical protein IKB34_07020 [Clostridia bacterium]|nr:hypothetical protein [Clostridia bacterium]